MFNKIFGKRDFGGFEKLYEASMSLGKGEELVLKLKNLDTALCEELPWRRLKERNDVAYVVNTLPGPSVGCTCDVPYNAKTFEDFARILTSDCRVTQFYSTWFYKEKGRIFSPVYRVKLQSDLREPPLLSDVIIGTAASNGGELAFCLGARDLIVRDLKLVEPQRQNVVRGSTPRKKACC
ncbi:MAG: hypothetical protein EOM37_01825 [Proteobacteria bacterium]|jgi:hypothetical protein|nr:hypothetical protein [Alphaproteobacteria bacterium]NCC02775.1 hypothetical protein [Pseudomonadota bacterium]